MQNKRSSRIEKSFTVRSIDRGYPERFCLLPLLCLHPLILTQILTFVTLPPPPPRFTLVKYALQTKQSPQAPVPSSACPRTLSQTERHVAGSLCWYIHAHPAYNSCHMPLADSRFSSLQATLEIPAPSILLQCQGSAYTSPAQNC